jgi:hypothetical protein
VSYVYIPSELGLWTVGFFDPQGRWRPESDWSSPEEAAARVHYLNGGVNSGIASLLNDIVTILKAWSEDQVIEAERQEIQANSVFK